MPPLDLQNLKLVKREAFTIAGTLGPVNSGAGFTRIFDVGDDGDFWLTGIGIQPYYTVTQAFNSDTWSKLRVQDIRSGYDLFYPNVRADYFRVRSAGETVPLFQPYCFTRTGAIQVTWDVDAVTANVRTNLLYITLYGWKEYQNAAK